MQLQILGGHQVESNEGRATAFLIDGTIAIDAGGMAGGLSVAEQDRVEAVLITHHHFDHIRDLPFLGLRALTSQRQVDVHCTGLVRDALVASILNGVVWLNLFDVVPGASRPAFVHRPVAVGATFTVGHHEVLPLENRHHAVPVTAYQLTAPTGARVLYTGDTGPGIRDLWPLVQPDLLITETTWPSTSGDLARVAGHLTPPLLEEELVAFRDLKGYLPRVLVCHLNQSTQQPVERELAAVARRLRATIDVAHEGMHIKL